MTEYFDDFDYDYGAFEDDGFMEDDFEDNYGEHLDEFESDDSMDDMATVCMLNPWDLPGEMNCDLDGDGINDLLSSGTRSWLSFSGVESAADVKSWIQDGYDEGLKTHSWLPAISGDPAVAYAYIQARVGEIVLLPVYNQYCDYFPDPINGPGAPPPPARHRRSRLYSPVESAGVLTYRRI